jgi:Icc protein
MANPRFKIDQIESRPLVTLDYKHLGPAGERCHGILPIVSAHVTGLPDSLDALILTGGLRGFRGIPEGAPACPIGVAAAIWLESMSSVGALPPGNRMGVILAGGFDPVCGLDCDDEAGRVGAVWHAFRKWVRWVVGVAGDTDSQDLTRDTRQRLQANGRSFLLDGDSVDVDMLRMGGIGSPPPDHDCPEETDAGTPDPTAGDLRAIRALSGVGIDILVLHWSPSGGSAGQPGSVALRRCLEALPPTVIVCCRHRWDSPLTKLENGTQVLNVTGRVVVLRRSAKV